jgi:hypothetical protein
METANVLVLYWHHRANDIARIHQKLSTRLGRTLPVYSTIIDWLRTLGRSHDITRRASGSGRLPDDRLDARIMSALEQCPFHSVRTLCSSTRDPGTANLRHLNSTGFIGHNLRLVPHGLSP